MSLENHPNFHAAKFATDIMSSYYECLRGGAEKNAPNISEEVVRFVVEIENKIDRRVERKLVLYSFTDPVQTKSELSKRPQEDGVVCFVRDEDQLYLFTHEAGWQPHVPIHTPTREPSDETQ